MLWPVPAPGPIEWWKPWRYREAAQPTGCGASGADARGRDRTVRSRPAGYSAIWTAPDGQRLAASRAAAASARVGIGREHLDQTVVVLVEDAGRGQRAQAGADADVPVGGHPHGGSFLPAVTR